MSVKDVDELSYKDAVGLWDVYQRGMAGPLKEYQIAYNNYSMLHNLTEILIKSKNDKHRIKPPEQFKTVFPEPYNMATCGKHKTKPLSVAAQAVVAMMGPGTPQHLLDAAQAEVSDGST